MGGNIVRFKGNARLVCVSESTTDAQRVFFETTDAQRVGLAQDVSDSLGITGQTLTRCGNAEQAHTTWVEGQGRVVPLRAVPVSGFVLGPHNFVAS